MLLPLPTESPLTTSNNCPLILEAVRKEFIDPGRGIVPAIDSISCEIHPGITALLGANGAGKSTLLRCLATLMQPDSGQIIIDGCTTTADGAEVRKRIGYVSLSTRLPPRLTVREVLELGGQLFGFSASNINERITNLNQVFALDDILEQRCGGLSTGQGQRANLARALLHDPRIVILDEPTTGLDIAAAERLIDLLNQLKDDRRAIILCTHDLHEVERLVDRIMVMERGKIVIDQNREQLPDFSAITQAVQNILQGNNTEAQA